MPPTLEWKLLQFIFPGVLVHFSTKSSSDLLACCLHFAYSYSMTRTLKQIKWATASLEGVRFGAQRLHQTLSPSVQNVHPENNPTHQGGALGSI